MEKNSFVMYTEYLTQIKLLNREQRGDLFTALLQYASGQNLQELDGVTEMAFSFIKERMDRDCAKYRQTLEKRRNAGQMGGLAKKANASIYKQDVAKCSKSKQDVANLHDNVPDSVPEGVDVCNKKGTRFVPPTQEQVQAYSAEKGYGIDAERFVDFYASKGWMVGKNKMKDWKAAVRNWAKNQRQESTANGGQRQGMTANSRTNKFNNFEQRSYDYADLERKLLEVES